LIPVLPLLRETWLNVHGKRVSLLVTFLMVSLSFVIFDTFLVVTWNLRSILEREQQAVGMEVFLEDGVSDSEARALADRITGMEGIMSVYYVSPAEAEAVFRAELPDKVELLDLLGSDFQLPASLQVSLLPEYRNTERISALSASLTGYEGVYDVVYGENYLPGLTSLLGALHRLDVFAGTILLLGVSLVVAGAIRLAVSDRAMTVEMLSVFGASDWFLKGPFLLEGVASGFAGSAGGLLFTYAVSLIMSGSVDHAFLPGRWITGLLLLGAATGLAGSWVGLASSLPRPRK
jgi:cell division transport system permease protein